MSDKSIFSFFGQLFGTGGRATASGNKYTCPNGHPMDPSWASCPRCEAESRVSEQSSLNVAAAPANPNLNKESAPMSHNTTISSDEPPRQSPNGTRIDPEDGVPAPQNRSAVQQRKITGVLVSFTWDRQGDLFVLYEGRNVIGKGAVQSEGGRPCDVLITTDRTMSNEHAVILCRSGRYELFDRQSTNGTFVDDRFVESNGVELTDSAKIKTGATVWLIRKIESDSSGAPESQRHDEHDHPRYDRPRDEEPRVRDPSRVR